MEGRGRRREEVVGEEEKGGGTWGRKEKRWSERGRRGW